MCVCVGGWGGGGGEGQGGMQKIHYVYKSFLRFSVYIIVDHAKRSAYFQNCAKSSHPQAIMPQLISYSIFFLLSCLNLIPVTVFLFARLCVCAGGRVGGGGGGSEGGYAKNSTLCLYIIFEVLGIRYC